MPFDRCDDMRVNRLHDAGIAVSRGVQFVRLVELGSAGHPFKEKGDEDDPVFLGNLRVDLGKGLGVVRSEVGQHLHAGQDDLDVLRR